MTGPEVLLAVIHRERFLADGVNDLVSAPEVTVLGIMDGHTPGSAGGDGDNQPLSVIAIGVAEIEHAGLWFIILAARQRFAAPVAEHEIHAFGSNGDGTIRLRVM